VGDEVHSLITIRPLKSSEGLLLKQLRLGALRDSPDSFSPLYEEYSDREDTYWLSAAERSAQTTRYELFVAEFEDIPCGLVSGYADEEDIGHIGAMWASPETRGKGIGKTLLSHVLNYLLDHRCQQIKLTVTETNQVAIKLYESMGFKMTGSHEPLREGSELKNLEMMKIKG
jgi:ribosomal protein S18 acetylase RimI-like enzyme